MQRRQFVHRSCTAAVLGAAAAFHLPVRASWFERMHPTSESWRIYEITTTIDLRERSSDSRVWVPLPASQLMGSDGSFYQRLLSTRPHAPEAHEARVVRGPANMQMLQVVWTDPHAPQQLRLVNHVALRDRVSELGQSGRGLAVIHAGLEPWLKSSTLKPLDGVVGRTARKITTDAGAVTDIEKARAIYNWIVDNGHHSPTAPGSGTGDVVNLLTRARLGGKCADLNGLFVALARASGVPARDIYGVRVDDSAHGYKSLGKRGDISRAQHCRAEFYAQGYGWVPVDPADVHELMFEEEAGGLPRTDARVRAAKALFFGAWDSNWVGYNSAQDLQLPGSRMASPLGFLMHPQGETPQGRLNSMHAASFRYSIQAKRL